MNSIRLLITLKTIHIIGRCKITVNITDKQLTFGRENIIDIPHIRTLESIIKSYIDYNNDK